MPKCALPLAAPDMKPLKRGFRVTLEGCAGHSHSTDHTPVLLQQGDSVCFSQFSTKLPVTADWAGEELKTFIVLLIENKQLTPGLLLQCHVAAGSVPSLSLTAFPHSEIHPEHLQAQTISGAMVSWGSKLQELL